MLTLLTFANFLIESLAEGYQDFTKVFDRINHKILINKIHNLGIHVKPWELLKSYLTERIQIVRIQGFHSNEIKIPSGVPQGLHLGSILSISTLTISPSVFLISFLFI